MKIDDKKNEEMREMSRLTIYVHDNCSESSRAFDIASWLKTLVPEVEIEVINIDRCPEKLTVDYDGPVYMYNGEVLKVGNPEPEKLLAFLLFFDKRHRN